MKTIGITAGIRWWYPNASRRFAERWNRMSTYIDDGFECLDLSERMPWKSLEHPMFCKALLWDYVPSDVERIVWFDSDTFACRPIAVHELPTAPFSAVKEKDAVMEEVREKKWPHHREVVEFFNAGVFVATRAAMPVFEDLRKHNDEHGQVGPHIDQEWLNLFVARRLKDFETNPTGWNEMPSSWNWFKFQNREIRPAIVHFAGVHERAKVIDLLYGAAEEMERCILGAARKRMTQEARANKDEFIPMLKGKL